MRSANSDTPGATDVLIVGGGPVGLALAVELGQRGVACLLVEERQPFSAAPRSKLTNVRSMEHFRRWGLAERLRAIAPLPRDEPHDIVFATRLTGHFLTRFHDAFGGPERSPVAAEPPAIIPQPLVEQVLRECAQSLPSVDLRIGWRLE